jgi:hypothetical protein
MKIIFTEKLWTAVVAPMKGRVIPERHELSADV